MAKRKYNKKSDYWKKFENNSMGSQMGYNEYQNISTEPTAAGEPFFLSEGSYSRSGSVSDLPSGNTSSRINRSAVRKPIGRYSQIRGGLLPYEVAGDGVNVREAIELCQKAYANVPIFRNTIDMMSEFANTDVYLEGGTAKSRDFFEKLFDRIKLWDLKDQYFREYYRSGNIFLYRIGIF